MGEDQHGFERGFPNSAISGLADMIPAINGERLVVGPYTPRHQIEHVIEPVRIAGWRGGRTTRSCTQRYS